MCNLTFLPFLVKFSIENLLKSDEKLLILYFSIFSIIYLTEFDPAPETALVNIPKIAKEWTFSFYIRPKTKAGGWREIIRINNNKRYGKAVDCCDSGTRIPAVYFNGKSFWLYICYSISGNGNKCWGEYKEQLPTNKETHLRMEQKRDEASGKYYFTVYKDGAQVWKQENSAPTEYKDATMYSALTKNVAFATLRAVKFENLEGTSSML